MLVHFTLQLRRPEEAGSPPSLLINLDGIADRARRRGPCTSVVW
jgi:hypothetical protein